MNRSRPAARGAAQPGEERGRLGSLEISGGGKARCTEDEQLPEKECGRKRQHQHQTWRGSLQLAEGVSGRDITLTVTGQATKEAAKAALAEKLHLEAFNEHISTAPGATNYNGYNSPLGFLESIRWQARNWGVPDSYAAVDLWDTLDAAVETLRVEPELPFEVQLRDDDYTRVKLVLRSTFLSKAVDLFKSKGHAEEAAVKKARATELQLYRASTDRAEYKEKALKVFANLKKLEAEESAASQRDEPDERPVAKKQKVEGDGSAAGAAGGGDDEGTANPTAEPVALALTGDKTRDTVRKRIATALRLVPERERTAINKIRSSMNKAPLCENQVASAVEDEMHRVLTDLKAYKTHARNIFANIGAPDNPTFRRNVLTGQIPATAVATLRPGDMASAEQQAKDFQIDKDALYHGQAAQATPTEGIFQCGKCKSDKVRFALAQTRSGDEPMTVFCSCVTCGNRWKFS